MRTWHVAVLGAVAIALFVVAVIRRPSEVDRMSDTLALASAAMQEERRASDALAKTTEHLPDLQHLSAWLDATLLPAFDRYIAAMDAALGRVGDAEQYDDDPKKTRDYLDRMGARRRAYREARDLIATARRDDPQDIASKLNTAAQQLLLVK
jgi:hypothetical protein